MVNTPPPQKNDSGSRGKVLFSEPNYILDATGKVSLFFEQNRQFADKAGISQRGFVGTKTDRAGNY